MKKLFLLGFTLVLFNGYAQVSKTSVCDSTSQAQEGTYHISKKFIAAESSSSSKEVLTGETLCLIEEKRHLTDTTTHIIGIYQIVIYPKQQQKKK